MSFNTHLTTQLSTQLCNNMYLEQDQNDNNSILSYLSYLSYFPLLLFYSSFGYYSIKFINYVNNKNKEIEEEELIKNTNYKYQSCSFLEKQDLENPARKSSEKNTEVEEKHDLENPASKSSEKNTEVEDNTVIEEKITKLLSLNLNEELEYSVQDVFDNMLSSKTLERALVIYYIFVKKGNYKVKTGKKDDFTNSFEEYNSYLEFKKYDNYYLKMQNTEENTEDTDNLFISYELNNLFNLDNSLDDDTHFFIGEKEYNINEGNFNMISWIYYSGLYEYLNTNLEVKNQVLKEMYEDNLLTGNLFLRYHLQLL
jgi:hypothetical protein